MAEGIATRSIEKDVLSRVEIFAGLTELELEELTEGAKLRRFKRGEVIYHQEDPTGSIFIVASGLVKLHLTSPTGKRVTTSWKQEGGWFGVLSFFDQADRPVNAMAIENSSVVLLPRDFFRKFLVDHPYVAYSFAEGMAKAWRRSLEKIYELAFLDAPGRLITTLMELAENCGQMPDSTLRPSITQSELAACARTSRENVNKWLSFFERKGWLEQTPNGLRIVDAKALRSFIGYQ
jgi:CRP-like cAMP-binding protein